MDKIVEVFKYIEKNVIDEWRYDLFVREDAEDKCAKAYNEGVRAMSETVCSYIGAIKFGFLLAENDMKNK